MTHSSLNPFKGASPLEKADKERFFGRHQEQELLLRQVLSDRIVLVHAPTGAGKSSLVSASLLPGLEKRGFVVPRDSLRPASMLLESSGFGSPAGAAFTREGVLAAVARCFVDPGAALPRVESIESLVTDLFGSRPSLCVVDQLEEIFTGNPNGFKDQACLFDCLGALSSCENVWLLLVVREDFLAPTLAYAHLFEGSLRSRFAVPLLTLPACEEVIRGTVEGSGHAIGTKRLDQICHQLVKASRGMDDFDFEEIRPLPIIEPLLLQVICRSWFNAAMRATRSLDESEVPQDLVDDALAGYVDEAFRKAREDGPSSPLPSSGEEAEDRLRLWCEEHLIESGFRKQSSYPAQPPQGLDVLCSGYFVSKVFGNSTRLELSHDRFVEALVTSNRRWHEARGFIGLRRREWVLDNCRSRSLLSAGHLLRALQEIGNASSLDKDFLRESAWHIGRSLLAVLVLGVFPTVIFAVFFLLRAVKERDHMRSEVAVNKKELAVTRSKSEAMSLAGLSTLVSEVGRDSELGLALAIKALKAAKEAKEVDSGASYANGYARSVLFARTLESAFQRREILSQELEPFENNGHLSFDQDGDVLLCDEERKTGIRLTPFVRQGNRSEPADSKDCRYAHEGTTMISTERFTISANENHVAPSSNKTSNPHAFSRVRYREGNTREMAVYLNSYSDARIRVFAGGDSPALENTDKLLAINLLPLEDLEEQQFYIYGLSLQRRGIAFFWRIQAEKIEKCLADRNRDCQEAELLFAGRLFGGLPAASWISPEANRFRALSNLGEITEVVIRKPAPRIIEQSEGGRYKAELIFFCGKEGFLVNSRDATPLDRNSLKAVNRKGVLLDPSNSKKGTTGKAEFQPSFPVAMTEWPLQPSDGTTCDTNRPNQTIMAIGKDGMLLEATQPTSLAASNFKRHFKLWNDRTAILITQFGSSRSLLVIANSEVKDSKGRQLISRIVSRQKIGKGPAQEVPDLEHDAGDEFGGSILLAAMGGRKISAVAFNDSLMAAGGSPGPGQRTGIVVFCKISGSDGLGAITQCRQEIDVRGDVTSLSFSHSIEVAESKSENAGAARGTFLAVGTAIGEVRVYAVPSQEEELPNPRLLFQSTTHVGEVKGLSWAKGKSKNEDNSQQLASGGVDGGVVIQEFPNALLRMQTSDDQTKEKAFGSPPPFAIFRSRYPITLLKFDDMRLYIGGEKGDFYAIELDPDELVRQACMIFHEGYTERMSKPFTLGGKPIDFSDICATPQNSK